MIHAVKTNSTDQIATVDNHPIPLTIVPLTVVMRVGIGDIITRILTMKSKICLTVSTHMGDHWTVGAMAGAG